MSKYPSFGMLSFIKGGCLYGTPKFLRLFVVLTLLFGSFIPLDAQCVNNPLGYANIVINEVSGDAGQSDGCNDGIVEIAGPPGWDIGCMVVTNTEWAVVVPSGTIIPADGVYLIACKEDLTANCGVGLTTCTAADRNGLACADCDFPALPTIDLDVCDPANGAFFDPAATGFTIDNSNSKDGDQVILFQPDGTPQDAIYWGDTKMISRGGSTIGGASGDADHVWIQVAGNMYLLGDNDEDGVVNNSAGTHVGGRGDGANATAVPTMPAGDCMADMCFYNVPDLNDPIWIKHPSATYTGCNSSYLRISGSTGAHGAPAHTPSAGTLIPALSLTPSSVDPAGALLQWGYTDHPNPGQPNDSLAWKFEASETVLCAPGSVTFTLEVYNWQHVSDNSDVESGTCNLQVGSYVNTPITDPSHAPVKFGVQTWATYNRDNATGITTMTYTTGTLPVGKHCFTLQWDDYSNCCGSSSPTSNSECYERMEICVDVEEAITGASLNACNGSGTVEVVTVSGEPITYCLVKDGAIIKTTTSPIISGIIDDADPDPVYEIQLKNACGFTSIDVPSACLGNPPCPEFEYNCVFPTGDLCPDEDSVEVHFTAMHVPAGTNINLMVDTANATFDPYAGDGEILATLTMPTATQVLVNEVLYNPNGSDGAINNQEWVELVGPPGMDISCYKITDGEYVVVMPPGTVIPPSGYVTIGNTEDNSPEGLCADYAPTVDIFTCNCHFGFSFIHSNGVEGVYLFDETDTYIDGLIWGPVADPDHNYGVLVAYGAVGACAAGDVTTPNEGDPLTDGTTVNEGNGESAGRCPDGTDGDVVVIFTDDQTCDADTRSDEFKNSFGGPNCLELSFVFGKEFCNRDVYLKGIIEGLDASCPNSCIGSAAGCGDACDAYTFRVECPMADLTPIVVDTCFADAPGGVDIEVEITGGTGPYNVYYSRSDMAVSQVLAGVAGPLATINIVGPTPDEIKISLDSIEDIGGLMCDGTVDDDEACINIRPTPSATITGGRSIIACASPPDTSVKGKVIFEFTGNGPFDFEYRIDGGTCIQVSSVGSSYTLYTCQAGDFTLCSVVDEGGCLGTVDASSFLVNQPAGVTSISVVMDTVGVCDDGLTEIDLSTAFTYVPTYDPATHKFYVVDPNSGGFNPILHELSPPTDIVNGKTTYWVQFTDPVSECPSSLPITACPDAAECCKAPVVYCPIDENSDTLCNRANAPVPAMSFNSDTMGADPVLPTVLGGCGVITLSSEDDTTVVSCALYIERTYFAEDENGDRDSCTQHFVVQFDTVAPELTGVPADVTLSCADQVLDPPIVTVDDTCSSHTNVWINEIHYRDQGPDEMEFVEIAGKAGIDLSRYSLSFINGFNGNEYHNFAFAGTMPDEGDCLGAVVHFLADAGETLMNGNGNNTVDGVALILDGTIVLDFISWGSGDIRTIKPDQGPAFGHSPRYVGIQEPRGGPPTQSLNKVGEGLKSEDFAWAVTDMSSPGILNPGQTVRSGYSCPPIELNYEADTLYMNCKNQLAIDRIWSSEDCCGNVVADTQSIVVNDNLAPVLVIPGDTTIDCTMICHLDVSAGGPCTGIATASDNCDAVSEVTFTDSLEAGVCPNEEIIHRIWMSEDSCGNMSRATQVISIIDTLLPIVICHDTFVYVDDWGIAQFSAEWIDGGSYDQCGDSSVVLSSDVAGGIFTCVELGINIVELTVTDACDNSSSCLTQVEVRDSISPKINCQSYTVVTKAGACEIWLPDITRFWTASDNCGGIVRIEELPGAPFQSGDIWPVGTYPVCLVAHDISGNTDTCKTTLIVEPFDMPITSLICNDHINFSLNNSCMLTLGADMLLEGGPYGCYDFYEVVVTDDRGNEMDLDAITPGVQLGWVHIGKCFTATVTDPNTGNSCWSTVCIEDKAPPQVICMNDTVGCQTNTDPECAGGDVPCPVAFDACDPLISSSYVDWVTDGSCASGYERIISRRWTFTDRSNNSTVCEQSILVELGNLLDVAVPGDYDDLQNPALECDEKYDADKVPDDISTWQHILDFPYCVDGFLLDSAHWLATGGNLALPAGPARDLSGERLPMSLGWNCIDSGPNEGHPSPHGTYYDEHPQWSLFGACWGPDQIPDWIGTGFPSGAGCSNLDYTYRDVRINVADPNCDAGKIGCFKVLRQWTVLDWCTGEIGGHDQIIKVLDKQAPQIIMPDVLEVGTDVWKCEGVARIPAPWITDNCSEDLDYRLTIKTGTVTGDAVNGYAVVGLELGEHTLYVEVDDCCGNTGIDSLILQVVDNTPPVCISEDRVQLSLAGSQSPGTNFSAVCAEDLNQASYDNCAESLWYKMIRVDELLGTANGSFADNTVACSGINGDDDAFQPGNQVYFDDCAKFCCEDADQIILVVLRVHDVDPGAGPVSPSAYTPPAGSLVGHFTDCWVEIDVRDKAQPIVVAPPDIVVSCMFWFDDSDDALSDIDNPTFGRVVTDLGDREKVTTWDIVCEAWCEDHPKYDYEPSRNRPVVASTACDYYDLYDPAQPDDQYKLLWGYDGYAIRTCGAMPTIRVNDQRECGQGLITRDVTISFPSPHGGATTYRDRQEIWVIDCDPFYINNDNCFDDEDCIQWPIFCQQPQPLDGCGADIDPYTNPQLGYPVVENACEDNCALIAIEYEDERFSIEDTACFKIIRTWTVIDWCTYDPFTFDPDNPVGRWEWVQIIMVRDEIKPVVDVNVGDCDPLTFVNDPVLGCIGHIDICATATDDCSPDDWLFYDYKLDLYSDGVGAFVDFDLYVGKLTQLQMARGQVLDCESKSAYDHACYYNPFADDPTQPFCASGTYPIGVHTIYWYIEDGCGNFTEEIYEFEVKDCKEPTPYCKTGIVTVVMPANGEICIWGSDLDDGSFDNCTADEDLKFYFNGNAGDSVLCWDCDDFEAAGADDELMVAVEIWVEDEAGNANFCRTEIRIQDNMDICNNTGSISFNGGVENAIMSEGVQDVGMHLNGNIEDITDNAGGFAFGGLTANKDYVIRPMKDDDPLNGVNTSDLVALLRHLLGKLEFTNAYQYIAADINNSEDISVSDIAGLRKLILGTEADFSGAIFNGQQSWRFVDRGYVFTDIENPWGWAESVESKEGNHIVGEVNFRAVKIGDINGDAVNNGLTGNGTRGNGALTFATADAKLSAGDQYRMDVTADNFNAIAGYQFTMQYDASVEFAGLESGALTVSNENVGVSRMNEGLITMSWNTLDSETYGSDEVLFTIVLDVINTVQLSEAINVNSTITKAEAYEVDLSAKGLALNFRDGDATVSVFELYQNTPNPFKGETVIGFNLPEAMPAVLTIYDVAGKVLMVTEIDGQKGYNETTMTKAQLNGAGVLYYQLDAANHTATKRMILVD